MKNKKNIKKINTGVSFEAIKMKNAIIRALNNERGDGLLAGLIFTALVVLAVIAMKGSIDGGFTALGTWFQNTVVKKVTDVLTI